MTDKFTQMAVQLSKLSSRAACTTSLFWRDDLSRLGRHLDVLVGMVVHGERCYEMALAELLDLEQFANSVPYRELVNTARTHLKCIVLYRNTSAVHDRFNKGGRLVA